MTLGRKLLPVYLFDEHGEPIPPVPSPLSAPRDLVGVKELNTIRFMWLPPLSWGDDAGGRRNRRYQVQTNKDDAGYGNQTNTGLTNFYLVNGVVGEEYQIRVRARNKNNEQSDWLESDRFIIGTQGLWVSNSRIWRTNSQPWRS